MHFITLVQNSKADAQGFQERINLKKQVLVYYRKNVACLAWRKTATPITARNRHMTFCYGTIAHSLYTLSLGEFPG